MSRRKQAKPRPIFAYEEEVQSEDVFVPIPQTNGHSAHGDTGVNQDDGEEFDEFSPLVMDTPLTKDDPPHILHPQSPQPPSIKHNLLRPNAQRPESVNCLNNNDKSTLNNSITTDSIISNHSNEKTPSITMKHRLDSSASISSLASIATSSHSNDDSQSPETRLATLANQSDSSVPSSPSMIRRGSKPLEPESDENDENLEYDSDYDDLEELLSELIKHKILPVSDEDGEKFICPVCSITLLTLHDLTVHIRSHNSPASGTQSNSCKICGKILSSQSSLDRHMLVHSGERPFLCKICSMSFTTNGNMHRHSRIHTKEETINSVGNNKFSMGRGKSAWRRRINNFLNQNNNSPVSDRMKSFQPPNMSQDILQSLPNHSQQSVFGRPSDNIPPLVPGIKRQYSGTDLNSEWIIPYKRQSLGSDSDKDVSPRKSSYPIMPLAKGEQPMEIKQEQPEIGEEKGDKEILHCPVCSKTFLCKYGLQSHIETHPNYTSHCAVCNLTFKNSQKLRLHRLIAHSDDSKESGIEADVKMPEDVELKVGFHDLSFIDFSVEKFAIVAKNYFEKNARTTGSAYLNFTCKVCSKAFPCETSLILHSYSHTKDKCTQCPICECDYADMNEFHTHMLKHLSDKAFEEIRPSQRQEKGDDVTPDRLTQHDFLAMFALKEEEDHSDVKQQQRSVTPKKEVQKPVKTAKNLNNDYFAKLGQTFAPGVPALFNQFPMFPPGYQPSLDDFHKMLQIATNMNMLPSMGPQLLRQGRDLPISTHSSPSKLPLNMAPHVSIPRSSPSPAHSHTGSRLLTTPTREDGPMTSGPEREINEIKMMNSGPFPCKYCDTVFSTYKALKGHIRSHLGLSPYQCNLCTYTSADKSSLIRHVRTHSGERPFQCVICDFAFTTQANCERHIRKKHLLTEKEDIDKSIHLNKFSLESSSTQDKFHSPDTICKYCRVDFRFFRALKNHLRSHNSCRQKPYQCQLCAMGFCTKANCLRHVQKMHPDISHNRIEYHIKVIDTAGDDNDTDSVSDDGIPMYTDESRNMTPFDMRSSSGTPQPPAAHSTPKPESLLSGQSSRHSSPSRHISPLSHMSPAPSPFMVKTEPMESCDDGALDFSMKTCIEPGRLVIAEDMSPRAGSKMAGDETPMDLSVKKPGHFQPVHIAPKPSIEHIFQQHQQQLPMMNGGVLQCPFCPMGYSNNATLQRHMRSAHSNFVGVSAQDSALAAQLASVPALNRDGKLLLPPKSLTASLTSLQQLQFNTKPMYQAIRPAKPQVKAVTGATTLQNLQDKIKQNLMRDNVARSPNGSETDLASVTKMIDVTDPLNFQAFFNSDHSNNNNINNNGSSSHIMSKLNTTKSNLPAILKKPGYTISLEHCKAINRELDNLQREGDVDEAALSQVREMALSVKEEVVNSSTAAPVPVGAAPSMMASSPTSIAPAVTQDPLTLEDENSGDGSQRAEGDKSEAPVKKKRNSYADSPHKLSCPYCPRAFPWVSSLTRHLLTHTGQKPFKCPRCPVTFSTKSNRERHLIRKHGVNMLDPLSRATMDRPYKCPLCVFSSFSTQSNLLKHYRDRHNGANLPETIADIERMSPSAIQAATMEMESRAAENPPILDDSAMNMTTEEDEDDLDNSVDSSDKMDEDSNSNPYSEMETPEDLNRPDLFSKDSGPIFSSQPLVMEQSQPINQPVESLSTKIAPHLLMAMPELKRMVDSPDNTEFKQEMPFKHSDVTMDTSGRIDSPTSMTKNIEKIIAEQKNLIEQKKHMELKLQADIRAQIELQHKGGDDGLNLSVSPVPMETMYESPTLGGGDLLKPFTGSAERVINPERDNYDVDKITACWKCNDMFPSRKHLIRHLKEHNIDLPFKCYLCDASYNNRLDCLTHQDKAHVEDWNILKEKNKVGDIDQFAVHMDKVVENNCNKLDSGSILEIPGSGNDDSKMEVISADYMQRKVYCSLCPKRFWSLQDLRRHMRSHTGERPFECDICQKRFTLKHSMMRHRKKHIGAPPPVFEDDEDSNGLEERSSRGNRSTPSRNTPIFPYSGYSLGSEVTATMATLASSYLFSRGLSGSTMTLGGLGATSVPTTSTFPMSSTIPINLNGALGGFSLGRRNDTNDSTPRASPKSVVPTLDSVKKEFLDCDADMLHNLLGVESAAIEKMLESADSQTAAKFLGLSEASQT